MARITPSAVGDRQMFPRHTKSRLVVTHGRHYEPLAARPPEDPPMTTQSSTTA
jgi:hypothetical protein